MLLRRGDILVFNSLAVLYVGLLLYVLVWYVDCHPARGKNKLLRKYWILRTS
jgi:hypothetical protein